MGKDKTNLGGAKRLSLKGLAFREAVADLLQVKPPPKGEKPRRRERTAEKREKPRKRRSAKR